MYRTERFLSNQLRRWVRTVSEVERQPEDRNGWLWYSLKHYRLPSGRIIPRNQAERDMYDTYKDIKTFVTTYRAKHQAPFGVGQAIAERCKMTLNNVKKSHLTAA